MPIEIKELHICITVNSASRQQAGGTEPIGSRTSAAQGEKDSLMSECVEQVLQILHDKKER